MSSKEKKGPFRSLHIKLVIIMVLLVVSVMAVTGTFLMNSITSFYISDFKQQIASVFGTDEIAELNKIAQTYGEKTPEKLKDVVGAYSTTLGIDSYRNFYILDGKTGDFLLGSNESIDKEQTKTPNIMAAIAGKVGDSGSVADDYMDIAIPIEGEKDYILYIRDNKQELQDLTWTLFAIVIQSMMFGLIVAILLSFLLSKTMTNPIESLTKTARMVAGGNFGHKVEVQSTDEIGELTNTFNEMAEVLKNTIEEVQGERDKLNTLFLHMTDGVAAFTTDGKLIHMNFATERLLGVKFNEDLTFNEVFLGMHMPNDEDASKRGFVQTDIIRNDRSLTVLFAPYGINEKDKGIMAVIRDVTEQKKLEDARREFVANVSHELRTPLTNIKSYTETIIDMGGDLPPDTTVKFLSVISGEADRMTRIVKDLLTLSRLDYGKMEMTFTHFSTKELLQKIYNAMSMTAENSGHNLSIDISDEVTDMNGDKERLEQVIVNVVSNAIKYTPKGGDIDIIGTMRDKSHVCIQVKDTGMGIPEQDIPRIFERFYRVDKARSRQAGGTGLGLAIAKEIVGIHKGTIDLESKVDEGTKITIVLPINLPLPQEEDR